MRKFLLPCALLLAVSAAAPAQPVVDGLVLASHWGTNPGMYSALINLSRPVLRKHGTRRFDALRVAHGNMRFVASDTTPYRRVYSVDSSGRILLTLTGISPSLSISPGIELDQDSGYVIVSGSTAYRLRGTRLSTLNGSLPFQAYDITRDQDTGDFTIGGWDSGNQRWGLWRMDRVTGKVTSLQGTFRMISEVAYNPVNGSTVVAQGSANDLLIKYRNGPFSRVIPFRDPTCVTVDPIRGHIYAANTHGEVLWADATGRVIKIWDFGDYRWSNIAIWGSRRISTTASGQAGTKQAVFARFHLSPNLRYQCALSFGNRPGVAVDPVRTLFLVPDALFFATAFNQVPGVTERFSGVTNSVGWANPGFTIPAGVPPGTRLYFGMAVVNALYSGGLDVSNVECIKVR